MRFKSLLSLSLCILLLFVAVTPSFSAPESSAQDNLQFPTKPITIIVPRAPGGANDILARFTAPFLSAELGQPVVVENVEGGGGVIGLQKIHNAPADGYTLITWSPPGEYVMEVQGNLPFPARNLRPIGGQNVDPVCIAVAANSEIKTFEELLEASKKASTPLTAGLSIVAGGDGYAALAFQKALGVNWTLVPFGSGSNVTAAVLAGHVDFGIRMGGWDDLHPQELRLLAFASDKRSEQLPDVPTLKEITGQDLFNGAMRGLAIRGDTDPRIIEILETAYMKVLSNPEVIATQYQKAGLTYRKLTAEEVIAAQEADYVGIEEFKDALFAE